MRKKQEAYLDCKWKKHPESRKATVVPDTAGKSPMEEGPLEEKYMDEYSPLPRGPDAKEDDKKSPHYVPPIRVDAEEVALPKKSNTTLITLQIPELSSLNHIRTLLTSVEEKANIFHT